MKKYFRHILVAAACLLSTTMLAQTTQWRDIYTAKKKDTIYGIAKKYGLTVDELVDANPAMKGDDYKLKKGETVFIPFQKTPADIEAEKQRNAQPKRVDVRERAIRVGVMLPLHNVDGDGRRMNVPIDADIRQTLLQQGASECDIIFGPLYTRQVKPLADFCRAYDIRMVIPFSISGNDVEQYQQIFQIYQSSDHQNQDAMNAFLERFPNHHTVFIDCNDSTSRKGGFTMGLRKQLESKGRSFNITNLRSADDAFQKAFSRTKPNVVVINTGRSPELNQTLAKLDQLRQRDASVAISLFGYIDWLMYTKVYADYFHKYDTYIPTNFFFNAQSRSTQTLEQNYKQWFHQDMQYALPRFAITGYDHAQFFLRGLHQYGTAFKGTKQQRVSQPMQTPLYFKQVGNGGMQNAYFMLVHYKPNKTIEAINY